MAGWEQFAQPLIFYEGENEEALLSRFIELCAKHPNYTHFQIAENVFKGLVDASMRSYQAAKEWIADLEVLVRIDAAKENGGDEPKPLSKEQLKNKILSIVYSKEFSPQEKKVMLDGLNGYATLEGWVVKAVDKKTTDLTPTIQPTIYQIPSGAIE